MEQRDRLLIFVGLITGYRQAFQNGYQPTSMESMFINAIITIENIDSSFEIEELLATAATDYEANDQVSSGKIQ